MLAEDTIAAIATPPGEGALAIVRLSGPDAISIAVRCLRRGERIREAAGTRVVVAAFLAGDSSVIDRVVVVVYRAPNSYTGEDMVEVICHGGHTVPRQILTRLLRDGARAAEPGEFTRRAFLNGKMDLSQAEAVAELIQAGTEKAGRAAWKRLEGGLKRAVEGFRNGIIELLADIEARLDFVDEEIEPLGAGELERRLSSVREEVGKYLRTYDQGRMLQQGALVVLAGAPNAGKSTLFNALVQRDRVLVSSVPGTTRDAVEELIGVDGVPIRLVDTAGIRTGGGKIEQEGIRRTVRWIQDADLVVLLVDGVRPKEPHRDIVEVINNAPVVPVWSKCDLKRRGSYPDGIPGPPMVSVSSVTGEGMGDLKKLIIKEIWDKGIGESDDVVIAEERQYDALKDADDALERVIDAEQRDMGLEIIAFELRNVASALGKITGEEIGEEVLDRIFSTFCIGK